MADEQKRTPAEKPKKGKAAAGKENNDTPAIIIDMGKHDPKLDPGSPEFDLEAWKTATGLSDLSKAPEKVQETFSKNGKQIIESLQKQFDTGAVTDAITESVAKISKHGINQINTVEALVAAIQGIGKVVDSTVLSFKSFTKTETWKNLQDAILYFEKNADKIAASFTEFEQLRPYLEKELQKPEYENKTLDELSAIDENGNPSEENALWDKAIAAARLEYQKENGELPKTAIKRADLVEYPLDKVNNQIWNLLENDTKGQLKFAMENKADKKKGKQIDLLYSIDFDELGSDIKITKRLLPFDKRVYIAVSALFNAGNNIITLTQIYYAMGYTGNPGKKDLEGINDSISKMTGARIYVNNEDEANAYKYSKFVYDGALLPIERGTAVVNGQLADAAIHIFREPPVITFAKQRQQITTIAVKMLQSPVSKTNDNLQIEDYLIERLAKAKKQKEHRILYKTMYEHIGLSDKTPANQKKIKQRLPAKIEKYLKYYQQCNYIHRYTMEKDGITVYFR